MGYPTPRHLLREMSSREFSEWQAYDRLEPIGQRVTHDLLARLCCHFYNAHKGEKVSALTVEELLPHLKLLHPPEKERPQSIDDQKAKAHLIAAAFGVSLSP